MSVEELIGQAKVVGDLHSVRHKVRYNASPTIVPGQVIRMTLPRYDDAFLDLRNIYQCFFLQGSSADPNSCIDSQSIQSVIDRIRVLSGSVVLMDCNETSLLFSSLYDLNTEINESSASKYLVGDMSGADKIAAFALAAPGRGYISKLAPRHSLLNTDALLPIGRCSELQVELTFTTAAKSIYSPLNTTASTWIITGYELHLDYLKSARISAHFSSSPFKISVTDYSWRYNSLAAATVGQIRWVSANSSLDKVYNILRDESTCQSLNFQNKNRVAKNGSTILSYNILANNVWFYEDDILGAGSLSWEQYEEMRDAFGQIHTSAFFTTNNFYSGSQNRIGVNFESAPASFRKELESGIRTRDLGQEVLLQITFGSAMTARVDSFLCSSVTISLPRNNGDLKMEF